ncbi:transcription and mRNA export factor ENY2 isoform X1 [Coffea eugenioides]|uniref:Transcription and mRNA export factor ENY2 n=1 Tax=Coffea arabica TaxID=13443 RepID=A0A6P6VBL3_COFAR|nr:transcription and mRNA export factor ENY2 isoform X1 [Coffea eugenioides]
MRSSVKRPPTPDAEEEEQDREPTLQEIINIKLIESGEKERLKELLRERLVECGWKDEMKALCRAFARKRGRNNVTVDDLVHVITPKGRGNYCVLCLRNLHWTVLGHEIFKGPNLTLAVVQISNPSAATL